MPDGLTQDSRNPNSPQWGYLKVIEDSSPLPGGVGWPPKYDGVWDEYVMFMHNIKKPDGTTKRIDRNKSVEYKLVKAKLRINKSENPGLQETLNRKIWVALITKEN